MTYTAKALYSFFSGFGIPAYVEDNVPDGASLPYITYGLTDPRWDESAVINARIWYNDTSYANINAKIDEISDSIGEGTSIRTEKGYITLHKDTTFVQFQPYDRIDIKLAYLSMIIHSFTN